MLIQLIFFSLCTFVVILIFPIAINKSAKSGGREIRLLTYWTDCAARYNNILCNNNRAQTLIGPIRLHCRSWELSCNFWSSTNRSPATSAHFADCLSSFRSSDALFPASTRLRLNVEKTASQNDYACLSGLLLTAIGNLLARPPTASPVRERIFPNDARRATKIFVMYTLVFLQARTRLRDADYVTFRLSKERRKIRGTVLLMNTGRSRHTKKHFCFENIVIFDTQILKS